MSRSKVLVLVSGSIAAYKACYLVSRLNQDGFDVKVAQSRSALNFIGKTSFEALCGHEVATDTFETGHALDHIYLMRWADLIIACPATANFINKLAAGIGDDLLTTLALTHDFTKPFLIAPAMNTQMYLHPATQNSVKRLKEYGFSLLETASGVLACNEVGAGKLLDPDLIYNEILQHLGKPTTAQARKIAAQTSPKILITSGGCIEAIDDVRAITNTSTGQTGALMAQFFSDLGFDVTFLSAKSGALPKASVNTQFYSDFKSLEAALSTILHREEFTAIIHAAAVSDYSVESVSAGGAQIDGSGKKLASSFDSIEIKLRKNPKLLNQIKKAQKDALLIGFKLTHNGNSAEVKTAISKQFSESDCDFVVHNSLADISGQKGKHSYNLYNKDIEVLSKFHGTNALAMQLAAIITKKVLENDTCA